MFKHLTNIEGVSIYPLISLSIFFVFFVALTFWALRADKKYLSKMGNMPLEGEKNEN